MALIEIDGLPNLIAWWIFPWQTVSHNQMVVLFPKAGCIPAGNYQTDLLGG